jgi:putative flippase GtrA
MTFLRYLVVQLMAYVVDMGSFMLLLNLIIIDPITANILSKILAGIFAFILQRKFTFRVEADGLLQKQAMRYFVILFINIPIASSILFLMLLWTPDAVRAKLFSDIACVGISYLLSKYFIFSSGNSTTAYINYFFKK